MSGSLEHGRWALKEASREPAGRDLSPLRFPPTTQVSEIDLLPWATYEHPAADSYGRQIICETSAYEILVMSWMPGSRPAVT